MPHEGHYGTRHTRPELIPDIEKFLPVSIFKMATAKLQHVFDIFFKSVVSVSGRFGRLHNR
jgi:hypothetical protein